MKVLFIGDPHLKISKFDISCKFLTWVGEVVDRVKPDLVINLGDTFDTHAVVRSEVLTKFKEHVKQITATTPYFYILGNHDMYKPNDSKYHALETFKDIPNFKVIDKIIHSSKMGMSFIPYIHDHTQFPLETQPICIAHQTFVGADYGYHRPDVGVDADKMNADIVISGHIHKRQNFGKVFYPGTPFAQSVDDVNQSKGLMLFDTDSYEQQFLESPFPKWKGMRLELSQDFDINDLMKTIQQTTNEIDNWVIEISGPKAEVMAYIDSKEVAKLKESRSIRFKPEYNDKEKAMKVKIKSSSMGDIVNEYVDKVYQGALDRSVIKSKALEVLQKSRNS
jgi:DNA repair exonuclease SbcCD nuclease subunit